MEKIELRDYFAGLAMQAIIARLEAHHGAVLNSKAQEGIAKHAYEIADNMTKAKESK